MPKTGNVFFKLFLAILSLMAGLFVQAQDPVANFTANNVSGCWPLSVTFSDQSTGVQPRGAGILETDNYPPCRTP